MIINRHDIVVQDWEIKDCQHNYISVLIDDIILVKEYNEISKLKKMEKEIGKLWPLKIITFPVNV